MIRLLCSTLVLFCLFLTLGCEKQLSNTSESSSSWPAVKTTDKGNFTVLVTPEAAPIKEHEHFTLNLKVDPTKAASEFSVQVNADMPAHGHGMNTQPEVYQLKPGEYRVEGMLFHMLGAWVINVDVTQGGVTEQALFPVLVEE